jgi:hypothetical protein
MYALWMFGRVVEEQVFPALLSHDGEPDKKMGMALYIVMYTGAIYASSISEYFKNKDISFSFNNGGSVFLAPNGKPSNLNPEQYKLVRTPAFKKWFGDWENDPETSSKVVDENGEPKIVYNGSNNIGFTKFDTKLKDLWRNVGDYVWKEFGAFFTDSYETAEYYAGLGKHWTDPVFEKSRGEVREFFLNIKKPLLEKYDNEKWYRIIPAIFQKEGRTAPMRGFISKQYEPTNPKYDGFIIIGIDEADTPNTTTYHIKQSNQVKLSDGTNTTFDGSNPDIRFDGGGEISKDVDSKLKELGFVFNNANYLYGKTINKQDYITAFHDKTKGLYKIRGVHKFKTPL